MGLTFRSRQHDTSGSVRRVMVGDGGIVAGDGLPIARESSTQRRGCSRFLRLREQVIQQPLRRAR